MPRNTYYHVPITEEEFNKHLFLEPTPLNYLNYFTEMLKKERPKMPLNSAFIVFEKDPLSPNKLSWSVFNDHGNMVDNHSMKLKNNFYPILQKFSSPFKQKDLLESTQKNFMTLSTKQEPSSSISSFLDKEISRQNTKSQIRTRSSFETLVLLVFVVLSLFSYLRPRARKIQIVKEPSFTAAITFFIDKIQQEEKREKFKKLLNELKTTKRRNSMLHDFQRSLKDQTYFSSLLMFINDAFHDKDIIDGLRAFLASIPDPRTRNLFKDMLEETADRVLPILQQTRRVSQAPTIKQQQIIKQQQEKQQQIYGKLFTFLKQQNKQNIISPNGAVSPVFIDKLRGFLIRSRFEDPSRIINLVSRQARKIIKNEPTIHPKLLTDRLLNLLSTVDFSQKNIVITPYKETPRFSPKSKKSATRRIQQEEQIWEGEQSTKSQARYFPQKGQKQQLVKRTAKRQQTDLGTGIIDHNIQRINESRKFKEIVSTLLTIIQTRQIKKVYMVDAPNLLQKHFSNNFRGRENFSRNPEFVSILRDVLPDHDNESMFVIVSQMNRNEWKDNDQVRFERVGPDKDNIFLVRVGCYADVLEKECYEINKLGNECDDFVRLDIMARLIDTRLKEDDFVPQFYLVTNDKNLNWTIPKAVISNYILFTPLQIDLKTKWAKKKQIFSRVK